MSSCIVHERIDKTHQKWSNHWNLLQKCSDIPEIPKAFVWNNPSLTTSWETWYTKKKVYCWKCTVFVRKSATAFSCSSRLSSDVNNMPFKAFSFQMKLEKMNFTASIYLTKSNPLCSKLVFFRRMPCNSWEDCWGCLRNTGNQGYR